MSNGDTVEIDSRPSDAIALAVRVSAPIFVAEEVMEQAGMMPEEEMSLTEEGAQPEIGDDRVPRTWAPSRILSKVWIWTACSATDPQLHATVCNRQDGEAAPGQLRRFCRWKSAASLWKMKYPIKSIPANLEAERAVLGSLLIDPDAIIKVANFLRAEDFFRERHGWLFDVMMTLHERREPLDFVTVVDELERRGQLEEIGGPAYITDLIGGTPTSINVDFYARIVERTALLRRLISRGRADCRTGLRREPGGGRGHRPRRDVDLWGERSAHPP